MAKVGKNSKRYLKERKKIFKWEEKIITCKGGQYAVIYDGKGKKEKKIVVQMIEYWPMSKTVIGCQVGGTESGQSMFVPMRRDMKFRILKNEAELLAVLL